MVSVSHYLSDAYLRDLQPKGCGPSGLHNALPLSRCNPQVSWPRNIGVYTPDRSEPPEEECARLYRKPGISQRSPPVENRGDRARRNSYFCPESRAGGASFYRQDFEAFDDSMVI